ncbi:glycosyltransferase family 2 protein [Neiella marina]|uniref:Glycosyltransferase family 2 protein n=1 Tax=Neiella holothuriorum TaxID=2870530 RepID=A0ABS7EH15_9GAMM|nr:glycosyltransferase family A protein [Neiella holothuriorum]MBW8191623.1 glycosyltransferase family 2 protein [Neiella holothuriorum]
MFVFLTSIRHPDNANDFAKVERLLTVTLTSICGQTNPDFQVVVVCNSLPKVAIEDPRIHFHVVDFPVPSKQKASALEAAPKFKDKGTKYMSGLLYAKRFNPDYVYIIDSDDWVNKELVHCLASQPKYPVWYVDKGYVVDHGKKDYRKISGLSRYCGSTFVYDYTYLMDHADIKGEINEHSSQEGLIEGTSEYFILKLICNHTINYRHFKAEGVEPKAIPLRTACWIQGTGENVSGTAGFSHGLPIDQHFIETFSLPEDYMSARKPSLANQIRDILTGWFSSYKWYQSKRTGTNRF